MAVSGRRATLDLAEERAVVVGMSGAAPAATAAPVAAGATRGDRFARQMPVDPLASHEARTPSDTVGDQLSDPEDEL